MATTYRHCRAEHHRLSGRGKHTFAIHWRHWSDLIHDAAAGAEDLLEAGQRYAMPTNIRGYSNFYHFDDMPAALHAARFGWPEGTKRLLDGVDRIADRIGDIADSISRTPIYDVAGAVPDVGLYCAGEIEHMIDWPIDQVQRPVIELAIQCNKAHWTTAEEAANWGAAVVALIDALELAGRDVDLMLYAGTISSKKSPGGRILSIPLKPAGEQIDRDRLAFALLAADMSRRLFTAPLGADHRLTFGENYGYYTGLLHPHLDGARELAPELTGRVQINPVPVVKDLCRRYLATPESALDYVLKGATKAGLLEGQV